MMRMLSVAALLSIVAGSLPAERAMEMLSKMNLSEKLTMMHGVYGTYVGNIPGNERLGIPSLNMQDGPQGFRGTPTTGGDGTTTAWPSALSVAASWDKDLLYLWASAMADEFKQKGANVALLPGIGIARVPTAGRNFEYICGEDPFLGSHLVKPVITGIQEKGIIANAKHFVNNEIETARMRVSANVNERVRFELYYPPFQAAVDVGVLSVMCAYNRINDVYACQNNETFTHLREDLGFNGFIFSDWTATKSTTTSVKAGLDQELPVGLFYSEFAIEKAIKDKELSIADIDKSVLRILTAMYTIGLFDKCDEAAKNGVKCDVNLNHGDPLANVTSIEHNTLARTIAATSTVLLKNDNHLLPLSVEKISQSASKCIAVIGDETTVSGGGSGHVTPAYIVTPAQGIKNAVSGTDIQVLYASGSDLSEATTLAEKCEVVVVNVATTSSEGSDRASLSLGNGQDELVEAIVAVNANTIVSVVTPGAILLPWSTRVSAILISWLPGQEAGNALSDVLFGTVNPSARLHVTLPNKENEVGFTEEQFPGVGEFMPEATYSEELLIGYRWYEANNVTPLYSFGHGLSYTTFQYNDLSIKQHQHQQHALTDVTQERVVVTLKVSNVGSVSGSDVVQLYLTYPIEAGESVKQLKGIHKTKSLHTSKRDNSEVVTFTLTTRDISIWDSSVHAWKVVKGDYSVSIGASSSDIRLTGAFTV